VAVRWAAAATHSTTVPYTVSGASGGAVTKPFNQQTSGGQWVVHGTYVFPAGTEGVVTVSDVNGEASADAVLFERADLTAGGATSEPRAASPSTPATPRKGRRR
jgi:hypothetical protein